jgi:hypothetical protein
MYFFGLLWYHFSLGLRISTPMLHIAFSAAQLHGTRIFYMMWKKQEKLIRERDDLEKAPGLPSEGSVVSSEGGVDASSQGDRHEDSERGSS